MKSIEIIAGSRWISSARYRGHKPVVSEFIIWYLARDHDEDVSWSFQLSTKHKLAPQAQPWPWFLAVGRASEDPIAAGTTVAWREWSSLTTSLPQTFSRTATHYPVASIQSVHDQTRPRVFYRLML